MSAPRPLLSHVGIAVSDFEQSVALYKLITGDDRPHITEVADQRVRVAIFTAPSSPGGRLELVAATADDSPIARHIARRGEGLHHICIYVDDINARLAELELEGVELIDRLPRRGAEGNLIAFVHPRSTRGVLIELEEKRRS